VLQATADQWQRSIKGWTVTTTGPLASHPYFIRLSKTGDPNAAISYNLGNGGPTLDQRTVIDAGFLELSRLGELAASDSAIQESLPVVDANIESTTPSGPGWHRYNGDGYGDGSGDGHPWAPSGKGTGHLRPAADIGARTALDQPANTADRYVTHHQGTTTLAITSPANQSAISGSPVTVTGTTAAGNEVSVAATNVDTSFTTATAETTAAAD